ncbi:hypothetical protein SAMN05421827_105144 [Pedobacter terrae]|uniref:Uncharacterized protein n=1 Tax=Pedobacter terrae TaxID=405671 RepID=A0A1G7TB49_9SPHI|nr:hypothetical protein [Pedobacter terrae]SDG32528.1 hypothetical protein SAMN05421827_105144 [Pedobacter terrae]
MNNDLELGIDFVFNTPEAEAESKRIETSISSIGKSADGAAAKLKSSVSKLAAPTKEQIGLMERLKIKLAEYQEKANKATSVRSIELANAQIQEFQQEIARLTNVGKAGFDDLGRNITKSFERPTGELNRAKEALKLYQRYAGETFNPQLLAKYNAKIEQTTAKIKQLKSLGTSVDVSGGSSPRTLGRKETLQELAKSYVAKANGSNDLTEIARYNKKLEETRAEIEKTSNAGKTGFDEFGNSIAESGGNLLTKVFPALNKVAMILPGIGVAGLLAFAIDPIMEYLSALWEGKDALDTLKISAENLNDVRKKSSEALYTEQSNLQVLLDVARNENVSKDLRAEALRKINRISPEYLGNITLETIKTKEATAAINLYVDALKRQSVEKAISDKRQDLVKSRIDLKQDYEDATEKVNSLADQVKNQRFKNKASDEETAVEAKYREAKDALQKQYGKDKSILKQIDDLDAFAKKQYENFSKKPIKSGRKDKGYFQQIVDDAQFQLDNLDKSNADFKTKKAALEVKIKETSKEIEDFEIKEDKPKKEKKAKSETGIINQQRSLQQKITDVNNEYARKAKTGDEAELQAVRDKFAKLSKEIEAFNANPKNKYKVDYSELATTMRNAIDDLRYKIDTEKATIAYEKQKQLFEDYENYKTNFGKQAADKRFGTEVKSSADLLKQKQAEYVKLALKSAVGGGLTGGEQSRMDNGEKQIKELQAVEAKRYQDAYNAALTYNQKVERINEEYRGKAADLGKNITDDQKKVLNEQRDNAINAAKDEALTKTAIYKKMAQETLELTKKEAKDQVGVLKKLLADGSVTGDIKTRIEKEVNSLEVFLKVGVDAANLNILKDKLKGKVEELNASDGAGNSLLSPNETKRILKDIATIQAKIKSIDTNGNGVVSWGDKVSKNFEYLKGDAASVAGGVSKDLGAVSGSFGQLSEAVGGVNTETGYTLDTIGRLAAVGSDAAGAFASFASGDIVGGVTKAISAVAGLFSIGKKVKEMNAAARKEVEDFYINAIAGEREYQDLLKERQLQTVRNNKAALQGIRDELALRKSQDAEYAKESAEIMAKLQGQSFIQSESYTHGTWFRKAKVEKTYSSLQGMNFEQLSSLLAQGKLEGEAKALVERLKELEQKGFDAQQALADLAKETQEIFTGTTRDSLTDTLLDMFKSGKTGVQDLADFFKKTMDGAALSIFKNKVLSDLMNKFYDEFAKKAESGDELTNAETEELQKLFTSLTDEAKTKFEQFKKVAGSDLGSLGGDTGLTGQITKSITEQTGSELVGLQRSMYDITKQGVVVAKDSLASIKQQTLYQYQIEINTRETATQVKNAVSELKTINSNMKGSGSTAYDRGFI